MNGFRPINSMQGEILLFESISAEFVVCLILKPNTLKGVFWLEPKI
jgi:hypothetical protein